MESITNIKVSVIIPMYYAEEYVDSLLDWLTMQPLKEIEIICVVDGSPDATLERVKKHAASDKRVRWIYQENAGAGAARNTGLEQARGEYLAFLDADDLYHPLFLTKMYDTAIGHNADIVVCQIKRTDYISSEKRAYDGFRPERIPAEMPFSAHELTNPFADISVVPQNKLFRKELIDRESLLFSTTRVANDNFFALATLVVAKRIVVVQDCLVEYRQFVNSQSISSNRAHHAEDVLEVYNDLHLWLVQRNLFEQYREAYIRAWTSNVHYNAKFERNEGFIEQVARTLAHDEPWCSMSSAELRRAARLDIDVIKTAKRLATRKTNRTARAVALRRLNNEEAAITEIVRLLNAKYGKNIPEHPHPLGGIVAYLRKNGILSSVTKALKYLRGQ